MDPGATTLKYNHHHHHHLNHNHPPLHYITSFSPSPSSSSYFKPQQPPQNPDAEISIFDAHKYFGIEQQQQQQRQRKKQSFSSSHETLPRLSSASSDGGKNFRTRSFHATPTASSEASWNSQTGLLVNPPGSVKVKVSLSSHDQTNNNNNMKRKKKKSSSSNNMITTNNNNSNISSSNKKWNFCCAGKKSVRVKEATTSASVHHHLGPTTASPSPARSSSHSRKSDKKSALPSDPDVVSPPPEKPDPPRQQRISASGRSFVVDGGSGGFSFPILKNPAQAVIGPPGGFKGMITKANVSPLDDDPPRDSLEVYQPTENVNVNPNPNPNPMTRHHQLNNPLGSPIARMETTDDDLGSDASSDLFELESFSTQTSLYPLYRRRDSLDEVPPNARRFQYGGGGGGGRQSLDETPTPSVAATECYAPSEVSIDWSVTTAEGYERASVSASEAGGAGFLRGEEDGGKRKGNGGGGGMLLMSCRHGKAVSVGPSPVKCSPAEGTQGYGMHVGGRPPRAGKTTTIGNDHSSRLSLAFAA